MKTREGIDMESEAGTAAGVYVHVPFCIRKCPYCDFSSVAGTVPERRYVECVMKELDSIVSKERFQAKALSSIYFGGGTPSLFSPASIGRMIRAVQSAFQCKDRAEVTLEANPDTLTIEKLRGFISEGVTRLSIGFQSLNDTSLKTLGRTHSEDRALRSFHDAREAGFDNIGVDLIFGIPGETLKDREASLSRVIGLRPEHISLYGLTIEEGTPFGGIYKKGGDGVAKGQGLLDDDEAAAIYVASVDALAFAGYLHYEISNFALPGYVSVHNMNYWQGVPYIGLGASAHSYIRHPGNGRRWWNERSPDGYMKLMEEGGEAVAGSEALSMEEAMTETVMLGLRLAGRGIRGTAFKRRFGIYPKDAFGNAAGLARAGVLVISGEDLILTRKGLLLCNEVSSALLAAGKGTFKTGAL